MNAEVFELNIKSYRANKARFARIYGNKWLQLCFGVVIAFSVAGSLGLLFNSISFGWITLLPAVVCTIFVLWYKGDLALNTQFQTTDNPKKQIHDLLEFSTLARIKTNNPSIHELWLAMSDSEDSYFMHNRFLIDKLFFDQSLDKTKNSSQKIWPIAENYRQKYNLDGYTNALLFVVLVASITDIDHILNSLKLDLSDIETAITWRKDQLQKRKLANDKQVFGGIGRDWAYGYTPILRSLGHNVSQEVETYGFFSNTSAHDQVVIKMMQMISSANNTITLVGDEGVGKSTCIRAFAKYILVNKTVPGSIYGAQIVQLDASTLLAHANKPGELESLMIQIFNEAYHAKNIILFFDDAEAFFDNKSGSVDLTNILKPIIESSAVGIIFAMTPVAWQNLSRVGANSKMQPLNVSPTDEVNTLKILRDSVSTIEYTNKVIFTYQALRESYKLGSRYVTNLAMPGASLKVLEQTATTSKNQLITREDIQASVEQTYGIKLQASTQTEANRLLNLEDELHRYVINQDLAIKVVSDALRRSRSGVGNPERPVGTFLFLGPTGVGKTELSKALAKTYFGEENNLIRVDMNQFVNSSDVTRLIQPPSSQELGFLGEVRKNPFSVILLDELEKAHQTVINALLQVLDEGVMTDSDNKKVSFKDAIIIATSNAGADEIRKIIDSGQDIDKVEAQFVETLISQGIFAPELINRFDEVVLFKPLDSQALFQVVDIIIKGINSSLDSQKLHVELTDQAKKWLVEKGYDSKLGARPIRRMTQRYVENSIAKKILERTVQPGDTIVLDVKDLESQ